MFHTVDVRLFFQTYKLYILHFIGRNYSAGTIMQ